MGPASAFGAGGIFTAGFAVLKVVKSFNSFGKWGTGPAGAGEERRSMD